MTNEYGIIAGMDVHKMWLYVAAGNKEGKDYQRHRCGTRTVELAALADWLNEQLEAGMAGVGGTVPAAAGPSGVQCGTGMPNGWYGVCMPGPWC